MKREYSWRDMGSDGFSAGTDGALIVPAAVRLVDRPDFYRGVAASLSGWLRTQGVSAYVFQRGRTPKLRLQIMARTSLNGRSVPLDAFVRWAYALDPLYQQFLAGHHSGLFSLRDLAPGGLEQTEFYESFYSAIHARDEIALLAPLDGERAVAMYFVRGPLARDYSDPEIGHMRALAPALIECVRLHERLTDGRLPPAAFDAQWQRALQDFGRSVLTPREQQIVQMSLAGRSVAAIAACLGIAEGTVKNHRKAIFRKLRVSSLGELTALFAATAGFADGRTDPLEACPAPVAQAAFSRSSR